MTFFLARPLCLPPYNALGKFSPQSPVFPSGIVSCDSDADSNRAMQTACETSKTDTLRNKGPFFPPLLPVGSQELVLKVRERGQFRTLQFVCETDVCETDAAIRVPKERETCHHGWHRRETFAMRD